MHNKLDYDEVFLKIWKTSKKLPKGEKKAKIEIALLDIPERFVGSCSKNYREFQTSRPHPGKI